MPLTTDAVVCSANWAATVNCISLAQGEFPLGFAMECVFVGLSIAFLIQHYIVSAVGVVLSFATAYVYLFTLRKAPSGVPGLPVPVPVTPEVPDDVIRICIVLAALMLLCLAVSYFSQQLSRSSFTAAWSLRRQFQQLRAAVQRSRALQSELQASREAAIVSQTARGIQELVAGMCRQRQHSLPTHTSHMTCQPAEASVPLAAALSLTPLLIALCRSPSYHCRLPLASIAEPR